MNKPLFSIFEVLKFMAICSFIYSSLLTIADEVIYQVLGGNVLKDLRSTLVC